MPALPSELDTARLRLRIPRADDAEAAFAAWTSDPEVTRYLTWRPHASADDTRAFLELVRSNWEQGRGHRGWIITTHDEEIVGMIGVTLEAQPAHHGVFEPPRAPVGYAVGRAFWGRGIATEAASRVVGAIFESVPSVHRVWSVCDVENLASARVLEKVGMNLEGILARWVMHPNRSPEPRDCRCYARLRSL